jgi:hypothetical protein
LATGKYGGLFFIGKWRVNRVAQGFSPAIMGYQNENGFSR